MPRTPEQYEEIRKEKKQIIIDAALELFANGGFHATSISKIAGKASISKGLMYNYFSSKEILLDEIIENGFQKMMVNFNLNNNNVLSDEEFKYFIETLFDIMEQDSHFWKLYFSLMLQSGINELILNKIENWYSKTFSVLIDFFRRKNIEAPETEAILFGAMLDGLGMNFILNPKMFPKDQIVKHLLKKYTNEK